jgi:hypothetical protein
MLRPTTGSSARRKRPGPADSDLTIPRILARAETNSTWIDSAEARSYKAVTVGVLISAFAEREVKRNESLILEMADLQPQALGRYLRSPNSFRVTLGTWD